ncbi:MAG TPA: hypothetical protein VKV80_20800 [Streptosporangiaceae bacterium]|nr:hypothetical protein [Streptosporangiaceae bacterium]
MTATRTVSRSGSGEPPAHAAQGQAARWLALCTVPCAWCPRVYVRPGSFAGLYAAAAADGWRTDALGHYWTCPGCQAKPGWWAPNRPATALAPAREHRPQPGLEREPPAARARAAGAVPPPADHAGARRRRPAGQRGSPAGPGDTLPLHIPPGAPWPAHWGTAWT